MEAKLFDMYDMFVQKWSNVYSTFQPSTLLWKVVRTAVEHYYRVAPEKLGGFQGALDADICKSLTSVSSGHWMMSEENILQCQVIIGKYVDGLALLLIYTLAFVFIPLFIWYPPPIISGGFVLLMQYFNILLSPQKQLQQQQEKQQQQQGKQQQRTEEAKQKTAAQAAKTKLYNKRNEEIARVFESMIKTMNGNGASSSLVPFVAQVNIINSNYAANLLNIPNIHLLSLPAVSSLSLLTDEETNFIS
jgi:hypothetical protein